MALGYPAITSQLLLQDNSGVVLTTSQVSWFASITALTTPFGGPVSGYLTDKIGRLKTLMLINVIAIVSWLIIAFSSTDNAEIFYIQLMVGRGLVGFGLGMVTTPAIMYASEVCHPRLRGRLTVLSSPFFISFGMLTSYLLGYLIPVSWSKYLKPRALCKFIFRQTSDLWL
jgi:MFS family permease